MATFYGMATNRARFAAIPMAGLITLAACSTPDAPAQLKISAAATAGGAFYQPLAAGDAWKYTCRDIKDGGENGGRPFVVTNTVLAKIALSGRTVFEFALQVPQVPSRPLKVSTLVQLLGEDGLGNVRIYGYAIKGKIKRIPAAAFVTANPPGETHKAFNYTSPTGAVVDREFFGLEQSNPTPLGTFEVAPYFEHNGTHDYGYALGKGIVEEDHGPNYQVDCLVTSIRLH